MDCASHSALAAAMLELLIATAIWIMDARWICRQIHPIAGTVELNVSLESNALMGSASAQMMKIVRSRIINAKEPIAQMENASLETSRIQHRATMEIFARRMTSVHMEHVKLVSPKHVLKEMTVAAGLA
jgi:hypothetical protein